MPKTGRRLATWAVAVVTLLVIGGLMAAGDDTDPSASPDHSADTGTKAGRAKTRNAHQQKRHQDRGRNNGKPSKGKKPSPPKPGKPKPAKPKPTHSVTWFVARVVDGDTLELGNGRMVRLVGIDTPEVGACGYEPATRNLERLVLHERVRLTVSDENEDRYGRLLRYVDVGEVDAGLQQIKKGLAIARYDSRDGYGYHPREPVYIAADRRSRNYSCPSVPRLVGQAPASHGNCASGYTPCVRPYPPDLDCADVNGPIRVKGADPHGLDADGDGIACE